MESHNSSQTVTLKSKQADAMLYTKRTNFIYQKPRNFFLFFPDPFHKQVATTNQTAKLFFFTQANHDYQTNFLLLAFTFTASTKAFVYETSLTLKYDIQQIICVGNTFDTPLQTWKHSNKCNDHKPNSPNPQCLCLILLSEKSIFLSHFSFCYSLQHILSLLSC